MSSQNETTMSYQIKIENKIKLKTRSLNQEQKDMIEFIVSHMIMLDWKLINDRDMERVVKKIDWAKNTSPIFLNIYYLIKNNFDKTGTRPRFVKKNTLLYLQMSNTK
jgi:hypothetical protein